MSEQTDVTVRQATILDLDLLVRLFDAYRQFYRKPSDVDLARRFLLERFQHNQSIVFLALQQDGSAVGFTQLFPSFSSVTAARSFILNDLYVWPGGPAEGGRRLAAYCRGHFRTRGWRSPLDPLH